jgi:type II secretory pathway pseudopilin PulG
MLLLGVLVFLAVGSLGLALVSQRWSDARRRQDEEELLRVGLQYRKAIESYYNAPLPVGRARQLPGQIEDLLKDPRFPNTVRHLREAYPDPLARDKEWGLVRRGTGLVGVYSQADGTPFRQDKLTTWLGYEVRAKSYEEWRFVYVAAVGASGASAVSSTSPGTRTGIGTGTGTVSPLPGGTVPGRRR